jgi:hypothetical protein
VPQTVCVCAGRGGVPEKSNPRAQGDVMPVSVVPYEKDGGPEGSGVPAVQVACDRRLALLQ